MATCYLDTSAVVKRYVSEDTSAAFEAFVLAGTFEFVLTPLVLTEMASTLRRRQRMGDFSASYATAASRLFHDDLLSGSEWRLVDFTPNLFRSAANLISSMASALTTLDALHLAAALQMKVEAFATADRQLAAAARKSKLQVHVF